MFQSTGVTDGFGAADLNDGFGCGAVNCVA